MSVLSDRMTNGKWRWLPSPGASPSHNYTYTYLHVSTIQTSIPISIFWGHFGSRAVSQFACLTPWYHGRLVHLSVNAAYYIDAFF